MISDVSIWGSALSEENINQIIEGVEESEIPEELKAHYKFNAGDGATLYDHSGNQNHGTINGATWECNDMDVCGVCSGDNSSCVTVTDVDGNIYGMIQIGNQLWMRQNLKVTHYQNGEEIPTGFDDSSWINTIEGA